MEQLKNHKDKSLSILILKVNQIVLFNRYSCVTNHNLAILAQISASYRLQPLGFTMAASLDHLTINPMFVQAFILWVFKDVIHPEVTICKSGWLGLLECDL